jgi:hypothetical protein
VEELNAMDLEVIRRALALPDMQRFADQVVTICHKLGVPVPEWAAPRPAPAIPSGGS